MLLATVESLNRRAGRARTLQSGQRMIFAVEMVTPPLEATPEDLAAAVDALYRGDVPPEGDPVEISPDGLAPCCEDTHSVMLGRTVHEPLPILSDCRCGAAYRLIVRIANAFEQ